MRKPRGNKTEEAAQTDLFPFLSPEAIAAIRTTITGVLKKRERIIAQQNELETAWRTGTPKKNLNRPLQGSDLPETPQKSALLAAGRKKRQIEALTQRAFLLFQTISEEKHELQIALGKEILSKLAEEPVDPKTISQLTTQFLDEENRIIKEFRRNFHSIKKQNGSLLEELERVSLLPCPDGKIEAILQESLQMLREFLQTTQTKLQAGERS